MVPLLGLQNEKALNAIKKTYTYLAWACLGFYAWAIVLTGANLPEIVSTFGISPSLAGLLVAIPAVGSIVAGLLGGYFSIKIGFQRLLALSATGMTISLLVAAISPSVGALLLAVMGIGFFGGMLETGSNGLIAGLYPGNAGRELNRLHIFFGIGAFISPLVVAAFLARGIGWRASYGIAGFIAILLAVIIAFQPGQASSDSNVVHPREFFKLARNSYIVRAWIGAFLFVAAELGFSNWAVTYLRGPAAFSPELASLGLSIFWLAILAGRYLNTRLPAIRQDKTVIAVEAFGSSLGLFLVFHFISTIPTILAITLVGLFMAGLLPWLLAYANERNPGYTGSTSGFIQTGTGLGMLIGPGAIGLITAATNISAAMQITIGLMFVLGLVFVLPDKSPK